MRSSMVALTLSLLALCHCLFTVITCLAFRSHDALQLASSCRVVGVHRIGNRRALASATHPFDLLSRLEPKIDVKALIQVKGCHARTRLDHFSTDRRDEVSSNSLPL